MLLDRGPLLLELAVDDVLSPGGRELVTAGIN